VRLVGVSDGFGALLAERHGFEALWASGLAISAANGVPDASVATMTDFLDAAVAMDRATDLPVVADCDTGFGDVTVVDHMIRSYERASIAAVCIEDKVFPKRNSFTDSHGLEDPHAFAAKLHAAARARESTEPLIFARLESLIAGEGVAEAIRRATLYREAGADALVIHSKRNRPDEVFEFVESWRAIDQGLPLIVIPTTYPSVTVKELRKSGVNAVIYANQVLRAAMRAIELALERIAAEGSSAAIESELSPVSEVLDLLGTSDVSDRDAWFAAEVERRQAVEVSGVALGESA
jgi:phosphoenolpyruvate phosphomutase